MPFSTDFNEVVQQLVGADRSEPPTHGQVLHCKPEHLSNPGQPVTSWLNVAPQRGIGALPAPAGSEPIVVSQAWNQLSAARFYGKQKFTYQGSIDFRSFSFFAVVWRSGAASYDKANNQPTTPQTLLAESLFSANSGSNYAILQFPNQAAGSATYGASQVACYVGGSSPYVAPSSVLRVPMRPVLVGLVSRPNGCTWVVGDQMSTSGPLATGTAPITTLTAGIGGHFDNGANSSLYGDLFEVMMYNRALSDREISRIGSYVSLKYGIDDSSEQLLFLSNSLSAGFKLENGQSWPQLIAPQLRCRQAIFNESVTAQPTTFFTSNPVSISDRYLDLTRYSRNTLVVWEGTNDLYFGATSGNYTGYANTCYEYLRSFCAARRTAGWKVIIMTLLPRRNDIAEANRANFETARLQVNASIRANWQGPNAFADGFIDVASLPFAVDASQTTNSQWYLDGIHLTAEGQKAVANLALPVFRSLDLLKK